MIVFSNKLFNNLGYLYIGKQADQFNENSYENSLTFFLYKNHKYNKFILPIYFFISHKLSNIIFNYKIKCFRCFKSRVEDLVFVLCYQFSIPVLKSLKKLKKVLKHHKTYKKILTFKDQLFYKKLNLSKSSLYSLIPESKEVILFCEKCKKINKYQKLVIKNLYINNIYEWNVINCIKKVIPISNNLLKQASISLNYKINRLYCNTFSDIQKNISRINNSLSDILFISSYSKDNSYKQLQIKYIPYNNCTINHLVTRKSPKTENKSIYRNNNKIYNKKLHKISFDRITICQNSYNYNNLLIQQIFKEIILNYENLIDKMFLKQQINYQKFINSLSKKKGLFRLNILSKRVNYSSRTVAGPDPYLNSGSISIPKSVIKNFFLNSYINTWNIIFIKTYQKLYLWQLNRLLGLYNKNYFIISRGIIIYHSEMNNLFSMNQFRPFITQQIYQLLIGKPFLRNYKINDCVLINRQPTLHKFSLLTHKIKLITNNLIYSLNSINCKGYNLDFDGDEINLHFLRGIQCITEIEYHASADNNIKLAKSGDIGRTLIQDSLLSLNTLSEKDCFLSLTDFFELILKYDFPLDTLENSLSLISDFKNKKIYTTGKQLIQTIINLKFKNIKSLNYYMVKDSYDMSKFQIISNENNAIFYNQGLYICGSFDAGFLKKKGLLNEISNFLNTAEFSLLLNILSSLAINFFRNKGITISFNDIMMKNSYKIKKSKTLFKIYQETGHLNEKINFFRCNTHSNNMFKHYYDFYFSLKLFKKRLLYYSFSSNDISIYTLSNINNSLFKMVVAGAKGSIRNAILIINSLGNIQLETNETPSKIQIMNRLINQYLIGNYGEGLSINEFFLHSISGRDGLLDTAIKTYKSGYLQRVLTKNLENIFAYNDKTLRESEKLDIIEFLNHITYNNLTNNKCYENNSELDQSIQTFSPPSNHLIELNSFKYKYLLPILIKNLNILKIYKHLNIKLISEKIMNTIKVQQKFKKPHILYHNYRDMYDKLTINKMQSTSINLVEKFTKHYQTYFLIFIIHSIINDNIPGEFIGIITSQSIGEPLTQMTLNTFHNTGLLEGGVAVGIPKIIEILQGISTKKLQKQILYHRINKFYRHDKFINYGLYNNLYSQKNILLDSYKLKVFKYSQNKTFVSYVIKFLKNQNLLTVTKINFKQNIIQTIKDIIIKIFSLNSSKKIKNHGSYSFSFSHLKNINNNYKTKYIKTMCCSLKNYKILIKSKLKIKCQHNWVLFKKVFTLSIMNNFNTISNLCFSYSIICNTNYFIYLGFSHSFRKLINLNSMLKEILCKKNFLKNNFLDIKFDTMTKNTYSISEMNLLLMNSTYNKYTNSNFLIFTNNYILMYYLGIESSYNLIFMDIFNTLNLHNISVNVNMIFLLAQYMTHEGRIKIFSGRSVSMSSNSSFIKKSAFEKNNHYFERAMSQQEIDMIKSNSSILLTGQIDNLLNDHFSILANNIQINA